MDWAFSYGDSAITEEALNYGVSGSCRSCNLLTSQRCKRCGDFYCSQKCQDVDWPNHRYICFPMPPLVRIRDLVHEDDVYPVRPQGITGNCLIELRAMVETMMKKLQKLENSLADMNVVMINDINKKPLNDICGAESTVEKPRVLENTFHGLENSMSCVVNNSSDVEVLSNGLQALGVSVMNSSRASLNKSQSEISTTSTEHVVLCTFRTTNRCAIRSKSAERESAFRAIIEQIDLYGRSAPPMEILPKVGTYAITLKSNKQYTRVKIQNVANENKIRVVFCDYGNTVVRKLSDLRVISEEISNLPEFVSTVQLHGVQMTKYNEKILDFLKSFERKEFKVKYIKENGNTHAELYDIETNQLLNEMVMKFCSENDNSSTITSVHQLPRKKANLVKNKPKPYVPDLGTESGSNALEPITKPPFQTHIFTTEMRNVKAVTVDTDLISFGYMACILQTDLPHLNKIQTLLNSMEFDDKPYEPKLNEYCVAKYENDWYRGLVVTVVDGGTKFEISYIDFLNESTLTSDFIRPYPKDLKIDCHTTLCKIDGLPKKLTNEHHEFLKSEIKVTDVIIIDRVIQIIGQKIALIECSDIINRMHNQNLI